MDAYLADAEWLSLEEAPDGIRADWLEDRGHTNAASLMRDKGMLECLDGVDWEEAFVFAGGSDACGDPIVTLAHPGIRVSLETFSRRDVVRVTHMVLGENDEESWLCVGKLRDRRWFVLKAGCCYSGWDVQAHGEAAVAATMQDAITFGLTKEERIRLNVALEGED